MIWDENRKHVHMFAAKMTESCGLTSWATNSEVVHAIADSPEGPYRLVDSEHSPEGVILPRFAHNPMIKRTPGNGSRYLLYHIGCSASPPDCPDCVRHCSNGTTLNNASSIADTSASFDTSSAEHQHHLLPSATTITIIKVKGPRQQEELVATGHIGLD